MIGCEAAEPIERAFAGEMVDEMTLGSVTEFVLDYVPRKVSTQPDAAAIIYELAMS
jgi:hypothetical protein